MLIVVKIIFSTILFMFLVSCFSTEEEPKVIETSKNNDLIVQFSFEDKVYSVEGNKTRGEKIQDEVGNRRGC